MILIFSQDKDTVARIARNQANTPQAVFGPSRTAFQPSQAVGTRDALFIIAAEAKNGSQWWPVIGDQATETYWTAEQALVVLKDTIPDRFAGDVYFAACSPDTPRSSLDFARTLRARLVADKRAVGRVFGHADAVRGPLPQPGDRRWTEVQAA